MDLADLTYDTFAGHVGETFRDGETGADLELVSVTDATEALRNVPEGQRAPFSLLFRGPATDLLPQSIRALTHDGLGALDIFLVPVAQDPDGYQYQAVFS
ncbi:MAG TPA: hypothetical protein VGX28_10745 [Frankiaceae bacterium]|jgi:hypothetical protein|nr:hypothetical protein [Frankiaceae bacterium]